MLSTGGIHILQEAKLKQWQTAQRPTSSLDSFAAASGYQAAAADAIARVRARLMGYADDESYQPTQPGSGPEDQSSGLQPQQEGQLQHEDGSVRLSPAAQQVLQELLLGCSCREERATVLPGAFMPPGLEVRGSMTCLAQALECTLPWSWVCSVW